MGVLFRMKAAHHCTSAGKSGKVRPRRMGRLMRQAMTMYRASAVFSFQLLPRWSTEKNISMSQRARYQLNAMLDRFSSKGTK